jgi:ATP-dependent Lhr-like helicase
MKHTARFHPAVEAWFSDEFAHATEPQVRAWPLLLAGKSVLIAAPTGSGKTLAAFLAAIDRLIRQGMKSPLPDQTMVVYVSPLKALSNDIQRNLAVPLSGIRAKLHSMALPDVEIRTLVRTGDTPDKERVLMRRRPPHIVVTTPESLYVLLGSVSGRSMLATTDTTSSTDPRAAGNKRGSHPRCRSNALRR